MYTSDSPELLEWIKKETLRGCTSESLVESMIKAGYETAFTHKLIHDLLGTKQVASNDASSKKTKKVINTNTPAIILANEMPQLPVTGVSTLCVGDRPIRVLAALKHPRIMVLEGLMSIDECDELIEQARPRLSKSLTIDKDTGASIAHKARVSQGMFFKRAENEFIQKLEQRISLLFQWPVDRGEGIQVLNYSTGGQYEPHNDYFSPDHAGSGLHTKKGGQRVGTIIFYLNTPKQGGSTSFPESGLQISAVKGNALFFAYPTPTADTLTLHGGDPVIVGEKWIATKWLRKTAYV